MPTPRLALTAALAAALSACGSSSTGPGSNFTILGDSAITVGPTTGQISYATGINDSGTVVGVVVDVTNVQYGWQLKGGTVTNLTATIPNSFGTSPQTVNDSGYVTGFYSLANVYHGFVLSGTTYSSFDYPGASSTQGYGMNTAGTIVGIYFPSGSVNGHAFEKIGSTFTNIDPPGIMSAVALGINAPGDVIGEYTDNAGQHGYLWMHGAAAPTEITYSGVSQIIPYGINDAGTIVGSCSISGTSYGFLLKNGVMELIRAPNSTATEAYAINNAGVVVGEYTAGSTLGFQLGTP
jgi:hypothetical protein